MLPFASIAARCRIASVVVVTTPGRRSGSSMASVPSTRQRCACFTDMRSPWSRAAGDSKDGGREQNVNVEPFA